MRETVRLFLLFRRNIDDHAFAFQFWHGFYFAIVFEVVSKSCEEQFSLILEQDTTSAEEDICFDLVAILEELLRVLEFEVVIVFVGLWSETNLFDNNFRRVSLDLFLFAFLLIEEFLIIQDAANGWRSVW